MVYAIDQQEAQQPWKGGPHIYFSDEENKYQVESSGA